MGCGGGHRAAWHALGVILSLTCVSAHFGCDESAWFKKSIIRDCDLPELVQNVDGSLPVSNMSVATHNLPALDSTSRAALSIAWSRPDRSEALEGFIVHIHQPRGSVSHCFWFTDFGDTSLIQFEYRCDEELTFSAGSYRVDVLMHPLSPPIPHHPDTDVTIVNKLGDQNPLYAGTPAFWGTDVVMQTNHCDGTITVNFNLAPRAYNFSQYQIYLIDSISKINVGSKILDSQYIQDGGIGTVAFTAENSGDYYASVSAVNTNAMDNEKCRCQCSSLQQANCYSVPGCPTSMSARCLASVSASFTLANASHPSCEVEVTTEEPSTSTGVGTTIAVVVGCVLGAVLLGIFGVLVLWKSGVIGAKPPSEKHLGQSPPILTKLPNGEPIKPKKMILFCAEHRELLLACVDRLIQFLQTHFALEVHAQRHHISLESLRDSIQGAEHILFIDSRWANRYSNGTNVQNDIFMDAFRVVTQSQNDEKVIVATFEDDASRSERSSLFDEKYEYHLPYDIDIMCSSFAAKQDGQYLHGIEPGNSLEPSDSASFINDIYALHFRDSGLNVNNDDYDDGLDDVSMSASTIGACVV